jgi:aminopeptidase YwaD
VKLKKVSPPTEASIEINNQKMEDYAFVFSAPIDIEGGATFLNFGLEDDYKNKDVKGKVIIINAGSADIGDTRAAFGLRSKKQQLAKENGVTAIIELLDVGENIWSFIGHNFSSSQLLLAENEEGEEDKSYDEQAPHIWVLDKGVAMAEQLIASKKASAKIAIGKRKKKL